MLSEFEIKNLENQINHFSELWPKLIGPITPKADDLIYHVIPFIKLHGTVGHYSEEDTEKLHAEVNRIMRPLSAMKNKEKKYILTLKRLLLGRNCFKK
jgi:hypothetical protein